jgi:biotin carboxyl carrier protein
MKHYRITLDDHSFDVRVLDDPRQEEVRVQVDGEILTVGVETVPARSQERRAAGPGAQTPMTRKETASTVTLSDGLVTAPLPGVIKSIAVVPGQDVARGDQLLVIEAMKMDNVIRASRHGTVDVIHVIEGRHVAHGDALLAFAE